MLGLASAVLFWAWLTVLFAVAPEGTHLNWMRYVLYSVVVVGAFAVDFVVSKVSDTDLLNLDLAAVLRLTFRQTLTVLGTILLFLVAAKDQAMSRTFLFSFVPVLYAVLLLSNKVLPVGLARFLFRHQRLERTLLVGEMGDASRVLSWCRKKAHYGLHVVGVVSNRAGAADGDLPVLGSIANLEEIIRTHHITQVISLSLPNSLARFARIADLCDRLGVRLLAVNDLTKCFHRPISFFRESGLQFFSLRQEPLECPLNRILKRAVDIALALPVVVFILPVLSLFVSVLHRMQSPGSLFFRQRRSGIGAGTFMIYKFRTMHVNHGSEAIQATRNDTRVFEMGRWLRKLSVDEIPQFLNVLKGEMSIVGPRPHALEHDHLFAKVASSYQVRTLVKPGITGLAQVRGYRGEATTDSDVVKRVESDVYYLENWSLLMEWTIIFRTAFQMIIPPRTAY
ncbi:MAG: hypothetical protein QOE70_6107 [Chthoniobacter sp.]|jgi:exopolysaccharide biosynthesis polyprenyl glycosylphosphotransferase|nr:hypothetical protein [Chthoniobacter sp.]